MTSHHGDDEFSEREQRYLRDDAHEMERSVRLERGVQLVAPLQRLQCDVGLAPVGTVSSPAPSADARGGCRSDGGSRCDCPRGIRRSMPRAPIRLGVHHLLVALPCTGPWIEEELLVGITRQRRTDVLGKAASPARQHLEVPDARPGCHHDPRPQDLGPPTQVEVLPHGEDVGIEPPSSANRSKRTRVHPPGARKTSRTASC